MERLGVGLGVTVALLWGSADILAALAARRLRTFKTTFVSQSIGLLALLAFGAVAFMRRTGILRLLSCPGDRSYSHSQSYHRHQFHLHAHSLDTHPARAIDDLTYRIC